MSHINENEDVVLDESGNVPPPAKKTKEAGGSRPTKAKEPPKKKAKAKKVKDSFSVIWLMAHLSNFFYVFDS